MTNDNITFYTDTLGAFSQAEYDVEGSHALNAEFFILTSAATYSAANLYTALAKERGLAKTIGTRSGGGACSVKAIVLPNGAIMQMSSNMNLTYSTGITVEEGVPSDYKIDWYRNYTNKVAFPTLETLYSIVQGLRE
jgi:C-terminal processing protease CtpA/Prc